MLSTTRSLAALSLALGLALLMTNSPAPAADDPPPAAGDAVKLLAADPEEQAIIAVIEELDAHQRAGNMNVPVDDGRLLRILAESIGAKHVVEIGTSNGFSGLWLCLALRKTGGHLTTFDIDEGRFALAKANFARAGVSSLVTQVLGDAHDEVAKLPDTPIDLLFIDADKPGYLDYLQKLLPKVRPGGLVLAHNMNSPKPDPAFVKAITANPALETLFVNMQNQGMAVSLKKR